MSRHQRNGVRESRRQERGKIRAAERAILAGARARVDHIGPNWKSGKFKREVPDPETLSSTPTSTPTPTPSPLIGRGTGDSESAE